MVYDRRSLNGGHRNIMLQTKTLVSVEEVRQLAFQLSQQDLLSLLTDIQERLYTSELMAIAESSFQEWNDPEEDIYNSSSTSP